MQGKQKMLLSKKLLRGMALGVSLVLLLQLSGTPTRALDGTDAFTVLELLDIEEHSSLVVEPGTLEEDIGLPATATLLLDVNAGGEETHNGQDAGMVDTPGPEPLPEPIELPEPAPEAQDNPTEPAPAEEPVQAPAVNEPAGETQPEPAAQVVVPVTWHCGNYNGDIPGEYTFILQLPNAYSYGGNLPTALVTVELPAPPEDEEPLPNNEEEADPEPALYDAQPETMADVQACIDEYEARYAEALESEGEEAAMLVPKARWEFEVGEALMPDGYYCGFVAAGEDTAFSADYYTFFTEPILPRSAMQQDGEGYWLITTPDELNQVRDDLTAKYRLDNDIDLTGYSGNNWAGIGASAAQPFRGELDGRGYTIRGLRSVPVSIYNACGLFRYTNGAYIHDINLETASSATASDYVLRARGNVGSLVGNANNSKIENCTVTLKGYMYCDIYPNAGGMAGSATDTIIDGCTVTINGSGHSTYAIQNTTLVTGGIVGSANGTTIQNSSVEINGGIGNTGGVYVSNTGGIVGKAQDSTIENCAVTLNDSAAPYDLYAAMSQLGAVVGSADNCRIIKCTANIDGTMYIGNGDYGSLGGIAGWAGNHTSIEGCDVAVLAGGSLDAPQQLGGIVGYAVNGAMIDGCTVTGGPLLATRTTYGYRVGGIVGWAVGTKNGAEDMNQPESRVTIQNCSVSADGTAAEKYQTTMNYCNGLVGVLYRADLRSSTAENLYLRGNSYVAGAVGVAHGDSTVTDCHVRGVDAEATATASYAGGFIGALYSFTGSGDVRPDKSSNIQDCSVTDARVVGFSEYVGGFAGGLYERNFVNNCHAENVEVVGRNYVGGFSGVIYNYSTVTGCSASENVKVTAQYHVGGFSGATYGYSKVTGCSAEDFTVTATRAGATSHAAGFSGWLYDSAVLTDCYAIDGTVKGSFSHFGGLVAELTMSAVVNNCYAQVDIICDSPYARAPVRIGGLVGMTVGSPTISNSYATGNISVTRNTAIYVGGLIGYRAIMAETTNCFATGTLDVPATSQYVGGLIGYNAGLQNISNCYFDTTTVGNSGGVGASGSWNGTNIANIIALTTTQMIAGSGPAGEYIDFDYQDTAEEDGNTATPWYIDAEATYPYLYYQYNGFSDAERDYSLGAVSYSDGSPLGKTRVDFTIEGPTPFLVRPTGAKWAYFPYTGRSMYVVAPNGQTNVPATDAVPSYPLYSLGGVSQTGIIGFIGMPSVVKTSDRPAYQWDNPDTYTYVWDLIRYEITLANRSTDYDWSDLVLEDPLPLGVVLVPGTDVTLAYDDGPEIILSEGMPGVDAAPFYAYEEASRTLTVYLEETLYHVGSSNSPNTAVVRFVAVPLPDAATNFEPDGSFTGDNIRNRGTVNGTLTEIDGLNQEDYLTGFDDRNRDPVHDAIPVVYDSNYDMDDMVTVNDELEIKDHCDTDGSGNHVVLPNDDPGTGEDYVGFSLADHVFTEWVYYNEEGTAIAVHPEDTLYGISRITVLFAEWDPLGPVFEFYKVDSAGHPLADAVFKLYIWRGSGEPGLTNPVTQESVDNGYWVEVEEYTSAIDPQNGEGLPVSLTFTETGIYQLIEATAPTDYYRLKNQWQFTASVEADSPHTVSDPQKLEGLDEIVNVDMEKDENGNWVLANYTQLQLPFVKVSTPFLQNGSLESVPLANAAFTLYVWAGTDLPGADALVTEETIVAGMWLEHSSQVTQADGIVTFSLTDFNHIYQLVETAAPDNFQLPTGQWRLQVENGDTLPQVIESITAIPGADGQPPPAFQVMTDEHLNGKYDGVLALINFKAQSLPAMGGSGLGIFSFLGTVLSALGMLMLVQHLRLRRRERLVMERMQRYRLRLQSKNREIDGEHHKGGDG